MSDLSTNNLTGGQVQEVLDTLLYSALEPIVLNTDIFDTQLLHVLTTITKNKKRKICSVDRSSAIDIICKALTEKDRGVKFKLIRSLNLERNMVSIFIKRLHEAYKDHFFYLYEMFLQAKTESARATPGRQLNIMISSLGASHRTGLFKAFQGSEPFLDLFQNYLKSIIKEYYKLCSTMAKVHVSSNPYNNYDYKDVRQTFLRSVAVALNKYDSSKGALTSYIKWWIFNAQTCSSSEHEYGIAYTLPQMQRKKLAANSNRTSVNFSTSLDALVDAEENEGSSLHGKLSGSADVHKEVENSLMARHVRLIVKRADIRGLARLTLDIGEEFTKKEKELMYEVMKEQNLLD